MQNDQVDEYNCEKGLVVKRGPGWSWDDQDGGIGGVGVILRKFYMQNLPIADDQQFAHLVPTSRCFAQVGHLTMSPHRVAILTSCNAGEMGRERVRPDLFHR